jgi:hypothetical protein
MGAAPNDAVEAIWRLYPDVRNRSGRKARAVWALPVRFTSMTRRHSAGSDPANGPPSAMPAFATTTDGGPRRARTSCAAVSSAAASVTSTSRASAGAGRAAATASSRGFSWPSSASRAPRRAHSRASAAPSPRAAPVTTTVRSRSGLPVTGRL